MTLCLTLNKTLLLHHFLQILVPLLKKTTFFTFNNYSRQVYKLSDLEANTCNDIPFLDQHVITPIFPAKVKRKLEILKGSQFISVQSLSHLRLFEIPWTTAPQASLSITNFCSLLKLMSIESVMPSNHLIFCCPLLLMSSIFPRVRVFSNGSALHIRWPKYCSFHFSISPSDLL